MSLERESRARGIGRCDSIERLVKWRYSCSRLLWSGRAGREVLVVVTPSSAWWSGGTPVPVSRLQENGKSNKQAALLRKRCVLREELVDESLENVGA
ncbi:unnamed protein product [Cyprideis torosa]|uniref:Uncharacterized protein n=1 Tax=Cyprideis torosa TaxID=163714 RepID=A0A7R8WMW1_9CRUS|nr:unnamed protein product [Cyprideis torosa]CAG0905546.1 unnamed protein product [Cyprideis torosa]